MNLFHTYNITLWGAVGQIKNLFMKHFVPSVKFLQKNQAIEIFYNMVSFWNVLFPGVLPACLYKRAVLALECAVQIVGDRLQEAILTTAVFPGSFDPPTYGHLNIIERASTLFDRIDVVIAVNPDKRYLFTAQERCAMLEELTSPFKNVSVHVCDTLIVEYCRRVGARVLLRGIRNTMDFS